MFSSLLSIFSTELSDLAIDHRIISSTIYLEDKPQIAKIRIYIYILKSLFCFPSPDERRGLGQVTYNCVSAALTIVRTLKHFLPLLR